MSEIFTYRRGNAPLLVSMPHSGEELGPFAKHMTDEAHQIADTDWHLPILYDFLEELDVTVLAATHSRYVVDLNRDPSGTSLYPGQNVTELCPTTTFGELPIYEEGCVPDNGEIERRVADYWRPYHKAIEEELARLKCEFGYALLWDAHSIASNVPRFFEGQLPDFNLGTNEGQSCGAGLGDHLLEIVRGFDGYSSVLNGRFKGGFITRKYGAPDDHIHAFQLELSQVTYMKETSPFSYQPELAVAVKTPIKAMMTGMLDWAAARYAD